MHRITRTSLLLAVLVLPLLVTSAASAVAPGTGAFYRTWARTDKPVDDDLVQRTWMWGPEAFTEVLTEEYADAPGGMRSVQYFDKSRMEDNAYRGSDPWDVSNGLLVVEMVSGQMQLGDTQFEERDPAEVNVAGDATDPDGPTYATFTSLRDAPAAAEGDLLQQLLFRDGSVVNSPAHGYYAVYASRYVSETQHTIAAPFWSFMQSEGLVYQDSNYTTDLLFQNPFYATGLPISEAYWANVEVGGTLRSVLIQCFERRCLTYTPDNAPEWQVEAGNVGQHYYAWRYDTTPPPPEVVTFDGHSGTYQVGTDIPPGTYRSYLGKDATGCTWQRVTADGSEVAKYTRFPSSLVTILATDVEFSTAYCEIWTSDLSPITDSPTAPFADGMYLVGIDIAPGTWINDPEAGCRWARVSRFTHEPGDIVQSGGSADRTPIDILPTDVGFITEDCGLWTMR